MRYRPGRYKAGRYRLYWVTKLCHLTDTLTEEMQMIFKKISLFLGLALFCSASCSNAEQNVLDNKSDLTQDKYVQEKEKKQDSNAEVNGVCFCKIHHCDSVELEDLNLIDILCEVWKNYGFNRDEILSDDDKEKDCGCTLTRESCGCCVINMCIEHRMQLDDLIASKLESINESEKNEPICDEGEAVESDSKDLKFGVVESEESKPESNQINKKDEGNGSDDGILKCDSSAHGEDCRCTKVMAGRIDFPLDTIGLVDINLDEDMSNLEPDGVYTRN